MLLASGSPVSRGRTSRRKAILTRANDVLHVARGGVRTAERVLSPARVHRAEEFVATGRTLVSSLARGRSLTAGRNSRDARIRIFSHDGDGEGSSCSRCGSLTNNLVSGSRHRREGRMLQSSVPSCRWEKVQEYNLIDDGRIGEKAQDMFEHVRRHHVPKRV